MSIILPTAPGPIDQISEEVVQKLTATWTPGSTGWQTTTIAVNPVDPNTHVARLSKLPTPTLNSRSGVEEGVLQWQLEAGLIRLWASIVSAPDTAITLPFDVVKLAGLKGPIQRGRATVTINSGAENAANITLSALPDYTKAQINTCMVGGTFSLPAATGAATLYNARLSLTSNTNLEVRARSYTVATTYYITYEVIPR